MSNTLTLSATSSNRMAVPLAKTFGSSLFISGLAKTTTVQSFKWTQGVFDTQITSLPDQQYRLLLPLMVRLETSADGIIASFEAADIHMAGETPKEAIEGILFLLVDLFETYSENENILGPGPARQLAILRTYIRTS